MYPPGFQTWVEVTELGSILEGEHRPGHFRGVATVVLKLFNVVRPDRAYFGQKDAQQVAVLRRMIRDLALEVELRVSRPCATRTASRISSRNALLSPEERERALALPRALATGDPHAARALLAESNGGLEVDYVEVADFDPPVLAGAVRVGGTRLIDNVPLEGDRHEHPTRRSPPPRLPPPAGSRSPSSQEMKVRRQPIVMVTAYDAPGGRLATRQAST